MRTTLTLDPDIARRLKEQAGAENKSFKEIVNEALRRGLDYNDGVARQKEPYSVTPWRSDFRPGVDVLKLNQLADELETEEFIAEVSGTRGDQ